MATETKYRVIGTRPVRPDGVDKVTGRALYGADIVLPRMAHARVLRSPHAHARIRSIDTRQAEALTGVLAVVTAKDLPDVDAILMVGEGGDVNMRHASHNILAHDKALYEGHAVAAVAATSPHIALEALKRIVVDYEALPPVIDVRKAMEPEATLLHEDQFTDTAGEKSEKPSNIASHTIAEEGDIEKGFAEAKVVVEREFVTQTVHQGYIEPHAAVAEWRSDGFLTLWCPTQGAFAVRQQCAQILQHPASHIKVVPTEIGGGFGGKISVYLEPVAAILSRKTGRPIKILMDRAEVLMGTGPTPGTYIKVKMGVDAEGNITAAQALLAYDAGAYPGSPVGAGCMTVFAPYRLKNVRIDGYDVLVNKPKSAAYRAPGATVAEFATETVVDEICEQMGLDPLEFRLKNGAKEGDWRPFGPPYTRIGAIECVEAAQGSDHWKAPLEHEAPNGKRRGRGVASGYWMNWGGTSSCTGRLNGDGSVFLLEGSTDIGGTRASIAMQFAEAFGVDYAQVIPQVVDTDTVGYNDVTGGSRTTFGTGYAAHALAQKMQRDIVEKLAPIWEVEPDTITVEGACYASNGKSATIMEVAKLLDEKGIQVVSSVTTSPHNSSGAFATHIADVEVDSETGKVDVVRYTAVQDAGKAIHPAYVEGQMQGGVAQGIGWALNEEYFYDSAGKLRNATLLDYRMPTTLDVPPIETIIVEVPSPDHPYGVRGAGEVPIVPPPAAIANAIYDAVGVRLQTLPMSPAKVCAAILAKEGAA
ncbi:MAG TPA: xanthine dehydrogenase family protein molybdopterin-binding subunit [Chthonomonadaceae bacterium]|nr:xanthine dehydrogenase family protein molybdopterin-binding subunit [Chthonomonadaceae bacterium]